MIVLIGPSATGKTACERELEKVGFNRIISYTSRSMRNSEQNMVDYHFISEDDFINKIKNGFFIEHTNYRNWKYGIAKNDCKNDATAVVEPTGYRQLKKIEGLNITSFFIKSSETTRLKRMVERGDKDISEMFRRIFSDQGSFNGIEYEVDYIIDNDGDRQLSEVVDEIIKKYQIKLYE